MLHRTTLIASRSFGHALPTRPLGFEFTEEQAALQDLARRVRSFGLFGVRFLRLCGASVVPVRMLPIFF